LVDWPGLLWNLLWVVGCALGLATLSSASFLASRQREKYSVIINRPGFQLALQSAGVLFCCGLAGTETVGWKQAVWVGLAVLFIFQAIWIFWNIWQKRML